MSEILAVYDKVVSGCETREEKVEAIKESNRLSIDGRFNVEQ